jgi:alpha-methylacyl-CoA racemase
VLLEGSDTCFAPVLDMTEAPLHSHNAARSTFVEVDGVTQPAPAPGQHGAEILLDWGWTQNDIDALLRDKLI